jgi:hypothetical protein
MPVLVAVSDRSTLGVLHNSLHNSGLPAQQLACKLLILKTRRDVRVVEGARLESVCRGNSTEGSNPSLSAKLRSAPFAERVVFRHSAAHAAPGTNPSLSADFRFLPNSLVFLQIFSPKPCK